MFEKRDREQRDRIRKTKHKAKSKKKRKKEETRRIRSSEEIASERLVSLLGLSRSNESESQISMYEREKERNFDSQLGRCEHRELRERKRKDEEISLDLRTTRTPR